ncbi:MAG: NADAR family protein [Rickettsiales bacterium]|nr:MAG: NADAR family protein [Rickettsiales bacterium]
MNTDLKTKKKENKVINFFSDTKEWNELSNFYILETPITYDGKKYATSEHLYQASKYFVENPTKEQLEYIEIIRTSSTPAESKIYSRKNLKYKFLTPEQRNIIQKYENVEPNKNWESKKERLMMMCLTLKFSSDKHSRDVLLSTENALLCESSPYDLYWGLGPKGYGQNRLGVLLMKVRREINNVSTLYSV